MKKVIFKSSYLSSIDTSNKRHWVITYFNGRYETSIPFYMMPFSMKKEMVKQGFTANKK